jgi:hypothetical protein
MTYRILPEGHVSTRTFSDEALADLPTEARNDYLDALTTEEREAAREVGGMISRREANLRAQAEDLWERGIAEASQCRTPTICARFTGEAL